MFSGLRFYVGIRRLEVTGWFGDILVSVTEEFVVRFVFVFLDRVFVLFYYWENFLMV